MQTNVYHLTTLSSVSFPIISEPPSPKQVGSLDMIYFSTAAKFGYRDQ